MTKPTKWASAQSDQSLRCSHEETVGPQLPIERTAKTLIRLDDLRTQFDRFCHVAAYISFNP